jgi:hypothetical protein
MERKVVPQHAALDRFCIQHEFRLNGSSIESLRLGGAYQQVNRNSGKDNALNPSAPREGPVLQQGM